MVNYEVWRGRPIALMSGAELSVAVTEVVEETERLEYITARMVARLRELRPAEAGDGE